MKHYEPTMKQIRIVSRIAKIILLALFIITPVLVITPWLTTSLQGSDFFDFRLLTSNPPLINQLPSSIKWFAFGINNAQCIKIVAITILAWEIIQPFYDMLISFTLTYPNSTVIAQFDVSNLRGLIIGVALYVIAWVMEEANTIKQEQDYTV